MIKQISLYHFLLLAAILLLLISVGAAAAQNGFNHSWWTVDGGGGTSSGGEYALTSTIGQADAGGMSGGGYQLDGGFWPGGAAVLPTEPPTVLYLPAVVGPP